MTVENKNELLTSQGQVIEIIDKLKSDSFPELLNTRIELGSVESDSVFLESRPKLFSLFWPFKIRYLVNINPKLYEAELPLFALEGILAHELAHTSFYISKGRFGTIMTGLVFLNHDKHVAFERSTDIDAITRGYGEGIKMYRQIMFRNLSQAQKKIKAERYYTDEEIDSLVAAHQNYPELRDMWMKNPPLNLNSINHDVSIIAKRGSNIDSTSLT